MIDTAGSMIFHVIVVSALQNMKFSRFMMIWICLAAWAGALERILSPDTDRKPMLDA